MAMVLASNEPAPADPAPVSVEDLTRPLPLLSLKRLRYGAARAFMASLGRLSTGIRIGHRHGFDSGEMLDHVYGNRAMGISPLGRLIDRVFLDAPGWAGIRNRGALVRRTVLAELRDLHAARQRPLLLADLACGGGRYVLDALADARDAGIVVSPVLRDYRAVNVARAAANTEARGVIATIEQADAFDEAALASLGRPDIVIVSGLHEIIARDDLVIAHLRRIAELLAPGGRLVLTVQPHHPQLEFIARVLTSHTGLPWAMRLRPLALTRRWLEEAGFLVGRETFEARGIFGVLVARRA